MVLRQRVLPPLDYLLAFEHAARQGSFAGAARELNISETAISRKVRLLEQHYATALFVRGHHSISLTPQGSTLQEIVTNSLDSLRDASRDLLAANQLNTINIGATNSVSSLWLMPRLRKFNRSNKQINIMLVSSDVDAECLDEKMHLSILRGEGDWPGYTARQLFGETIFPVCSPGYLSANPNARKLEQIASLDLIEVASAHTEWMNWKSWLANNNMDNVELEHTTGFNTYPLSVQAAVDGLGIALGWRHLVDPLLETGKLVRPLEDVHVRTQSGYYLLKPEGKKSFAELDAVESWLIRESELCRRQRLRR